MAYILASREASGDACFALTTMTRWLWEYNINLFTLGTSLAMVGRLGTENNCVTGTNAQTLCRFTYGCLSHYLFS